MSHGFLLKKRSHALNYSYIDMKYFCLKLRKNDLTLIFSAYFINFFMKCSLVTVNFEILYQQQQQLYLFHHNVQFIQLLPKFIFSQNDSSVPYPSRSNNKLFSFDIFNFHLFLNSELTQIIFILIEFDFIDDYKKTHIITSQIQQSKHKDKKIRLRRFKQSQITSRSYKNKKWSLNVMLRIIWKRYIVRLKHKYLQFNKKNSLYQTIFKIQHNFQEEVKSLSEFLSTETQEKQLELYQDNQFMDEIANQFDLLLIVHHISKQLTLLRIVNRKRIKLIKITRLNQCQFKINIKTPSLNKICPSHNKEIIMIEINSKLKKIEERFACVDCISDHPNCQYRTIEKINQQWNHTKKKEDRIFSDLKMKRQEN
ncbi:unnamed protein product [Paramecium octaurelia]|uniref:Uncharacterized protein n=1 Tax=Paramecium octaurelia TaxID=43137 RepID=A0A8S1YI39_PAROT|nr:unnamed protein product [Paramecium octaurelia]